MRCCCCLLFVCLFFLWCLVLFYPNLCCCNLHDMYLGLNSGYRLAHHTMCESTQPCFATSNAHPRKPFVLEGKRGQLHNKQCSVVLDLGGFGVFGPGTPLFCFVLFCCVRRHQLPSKTSEPQTCTHRENSHDCLFVFSLRVFSFGLLLLMFVFCFCFCFFCLLASLFSLFSLFAVNECLHQPPPPIHQQQQQPAALG